MEQDLFDRPGMGILSPQGELRALRHTSPRAASAIECWLPSATTEELDRMAQRERLALALGLDLHAAGHVADRLHLRDRQQTGMTFCCECAHLRGRPGGWRCASLAGLPGPIAGEFVHRLGQRCPGFDQNPQWPDGGPAVAVPFEAAKEIPL